MKLFSSSGNFVNGNDAEKNIIKFLFIYFLIQVVFQFFNLNSEQNRDCVKRSGLLLWQLLMAPHDQIEPEIQREVCLAIRWVLKSSQKIKVKEYLNICNNYKPFFFFLISSGLNTLYQSESELNNLLKFVFTEGENCK